MKATRLALVAVLLAACDDDELGAAPHDGSVDAARDADSSLDAGCGFTPAVQAAGYGWAGNGSFILHHDRFSIHESAAIMVTRYEADGGVRGTCEAELLSCADIESLNTAFAPFEVTSEFSADAQVIGSDPRLIDGTVLVVDRADGKQLILGRGIACEPPLPDPACRGLQALMDLRSALYRIETVVAQAPRCGTLLPFR